MIVIALVTTAVLTSIFVMTDSAHAAGPLTESCTARLTEIDEEDEPEEQSQPALGVTFTTSDRPHRPSNWNILTRPGDSIPLYAEIINNTSERQTNIRVQMWSPNDPDPFTLTLQGAKRTAVDGTETELRLTDLGSLVIEDQYVQYGDLDSGARLRLEFLANLDDAADIDWETSQRLILLIESDQATDSRTNPSPYLFFSIRGRVDPFDSRFSLSDVIYMPAPIVTVSNATPVPGEAITISISISNAGNYPIRHVSVEPWPQSTGQTRIATFIPGTLTQASDLLIFDEELPNSQWDETMEDYYFLGGFHIRQLDPGQTWRYSYEVCIEDDAVPGTTVGITTLITPWYHLASDSRRFIEDGALESFTDKQNLTITAPTQSESVPTVSLEANRTIIHTDMSPIFIATVVNPPGAEDLTGAILSINLPKALKYNLGSSSLTYAEYTDANSRSVPDNWIQNGYNLPNLPAGESVAISFSATVSQIAAPGINVSLWASVSCGVHISCEAQDLFKFTVVPRRAAKISHWARGEPYKPHDDIWHWFYIENIGSQTIRNGLLVLEQLSTNTVYRHESGPNRTTYYIDQGGGETRDHDSPPPTWVANGYPVTCLAPGETAAISFAAQITEDAGSGTDATATVSFIVDPGDQTADCGVTEQYIEAEAALHVHRTAKIDFGLKLLTAENVICLHQAVIGAGEWRDDDDCRALVKQHMPKQFDDETSTLTGTVDGLRSTTDALIASISAIQEALGTKDEGSGLWGAVKSLESVVGQEDDVYCALGDWECLSDRESLECEGEEDCTLSLRIRWLSNIQRSLGSDDLWYLLLESYHRAGEYIEEYEPLTCERNDYSCLSRNGFSIKCKRDDYAITECWYDTPDVVLARSGPFGISCTLRSHISCWYRVLLELNGYLWATEQIEELWDEQATLLGTINATRTDVSENKGLLDILTDPKHLAVEAVAALIGLFVSSLFLNRMSVRGTVTLVVIGATIFLVLWPIPAVDVELGLLLGVTGYATLGAVFLFADHLGLLHHWPSFRNFFGLDRIQTNLSTSLVEPPDYSG